MTTNKPIIASKEEFSLLSALIQDAKAVDDVVSVMSDKDFYYPNHQTIYLAIMKMMTAGVPVDLMTLSNEVEKDGISFQTVADIANSLGTPANVKHYAQIIADRAAERRLNIVGGQIAEISLQTNISTKDKLDKAGALFAGVSSKMGEAILYSKPLAGQWVDGMNARLEREDGLEGHATGFIDLDDKTCGLSPGDLVIVAGRPSMGKTSFALSVADEMLKNGKSVFIESIEMTSQKIMDRMVSRKSKVDLKRIRMAKEMHDIEWSRATTACMQLGESKLTIFESINPTVFEIMSRARRIKQVQGLDLVVIDYLQLMGGGKAENETLRIAEITRSLKGMAKALGVPVMLLSQLNRSLEQRSNKRPLMSDLRQSGAIEQDADIIIFMYREVVYDKATKYPNVAEAIVAKNRDGETGDVILLFEGSYAAFYNYAGDYEPAAQAIAGNSKGFEYNQ